MGYVANPPTSGPSLILSPAVKDWGPPIWQGLCSQRATCGPLLIKLPGCEAFGNPQMAGVM